MTIITTAYEWKQDMASYFSDAHKDAYGCRSCLDIENMTMEEIIKECDRIERDVRYAIKEENARQAWRRSEWEASISSAISAGAKGYIDAIRWLMDAAGCFAETVDVCWYNFEDFIWDTGMSWDERDDLQSIAEPMLIEHTRSLSIR